MCTHLAVGHRVLYALGASAIVLVAEGWFYAKDLLSFDS